MGEGRGRPCRLEDEAVRKAIRLAAALPISEEKSALSVGVTGETWRRWKRRADVCQEFRDAPPESLTVPELRELGTRIGITKPKPGGRRRKPNKADWIRALDARAEIYEGFRGDLEAAKPSREAHLLGNLQELADGGQRRRVREVYKVDGDGTRVLVSVIVDVSDVAPDRRAIDRMLELQDPERYGRRKPLDPPPSGDPDTMAEEMYAALIAMVETVPAPESGADG